MNFVIDELVETERNFGDDLQAVIEGYYYYFVENDVRYNISVCDLKSVFGGLETIYNFSRRLYDALNRVSYSVLKTARTFLKFSIGFNDYVLYCTGYERTIARLNQMMENKLFAKAVEVQQKRLGHSLPLSSYLLKPVQRVLKYHLFWEKIMKQWSRPPGLTLEEKFYVRKAFESMTQLAENINAEKKRCDRIERVVQLQSRIINFPLDEIPMPSQGELLLDGSLKMLNSKSRRYLFLYERVFLITKEQNGYFLCKACIPSANMMISDTVPNHPMAFEIISFGVTSSRHCFEAESMNIKQQWIKEVKRIMFDQCAVKITRPSFRGYSFGGAVGLPKTRPISTASEVNVGSKPEITHFPKKSYSFTPAKRKEQRHIRFETSAPAKIETKKEEEFVSGAVFDRMLTERYANGFDEEEEDREEVMGKFWVSSPHLKSDYRRSRSSLVAEQIRRKKMERTNRDI